MKDMLHVMSMVQTPSLLEIGGHIAASRTHTCNAKR